MRQQQSAPLRPLHDSMVGRSREPSGFGTMVITPEQREALERVALETFTSMVNNGHTFQASLAAVYFSGITHALEMTAPTTNSEYSK